MSSGLHTVRKLRAGKPALWYIYAWRGGPCIHRQEGGTRPQITAEIMEAAVDARRGQVSQKAEGTLLGLVRDFKASAEWEKLAKSTRANYQTWFTRIEEQFGDAPLAAFNDRRMRGEVLEWRDKWSSKPRAADLAIQAFSRLLSFGFDRGRLTANVVTGIDRLYDADRSDIIWEPKHFEQFQPHASVEVQEGVDLCAATGLRREDLVRLPRTAVGDHAIIWKTGKSRGRKQIVVPLLPAAKAVIKRIEERHASSGTKKPLPPTILSNSRWEPWTPGGYGSRFNDAKVASGIDLHFHDLRGTFATRCMIAGLTDQEIADILGWETKEVARIRAKYVDQARVVIALAERIAAAKVG